MVKDIGIMFLLKIILFFAVIIFLYFISTIFSSYKLTKRISKYSINMGNHNVSIYDSIINGYYDIIKYLRKPMKKHFLGLSKFYQKYTYIDFSESVDIISNKFLFGLFIPLLYIFASVIRHSNIKTINIIYLFIIGFNSLDIIFYILQKRKYKNMENDMLNAIIIMNNAFKSGKSTIQAVEVASKKLNGPLKYEFKKILKEMQYGLTIDVVFDRFSKRVNVESATYVSTSLITLSKTGGNIVKVFNSIERTLFDKKKLEEELKSTTTASNFVVKILTIVPFVLIISIYILSPSYFQPLFESVIGYGILVLTFIIFLLYLIILNRIVKVDY